MEEGEGGDKVGVKGPGIRRALLFRRLVQPPRYAISAEARGVYRRRGRAQRRTRRGWWVKDGRREGGRMGGRGLVRQGSRVDAWARVRPQERDGDRDCREGTGGREGAAVERRGEDRSVGEREAREGWTGWIRRLAAIDFSRQTRGLFVPLLVLVSPSSVPLSSPLSLFPWRSRPAYPAPRHLRPFHSRSLAPSLLSCSLMPCRPSTLDPCSLSLFLLLFFLFLFSICIRGSLLIVLSLSFFTFRPVSLLIFFFLLLLLLLATHSS